MGREVRWNCVVFGQVFRESIYIMLSVLTVHLLLGPSPHKIKNAGYEAGQGAGEHTDLSAIHQIPQGEPVFFFFVPEMVRDCRMFL